jgi:DNA-binding NarL/FixJ family response regulator
MTDQSHLHVVVVEDDLNICNFLKKIMTPLPWVLSLSFLHSVEQLTAYRTTHGPDLFLLDISLPDGKTIPLIPDLISRFPLAKILIFTQHSEPEIVVEAFKKGAHGYVLKDVNESQLLYMIDAQLKGGTPMSPAIAGHLLIQLREQPSQESPLSDQEFTVLKLLAKGCTYDDISLALAIKKPTVATYVRRIYEKLDVHNRSEAIFEANRAGWLSLDN